MNPINEPKFECVRKLASNIINNYPVDQAIDLLLDKIVPHLTVCDPIVVFGTKDGYTFMTHGFTKHPQCSRRCFKDCAINWMDYHDQQYPNWCTGCHRDWIKGCVCP